MDFQLEWTPTVYLAFGVGIALGALVVFAFRGRSGGADRARAEQLSAELDETREELDNQREEIARHFAETSNLFRDLTEQYTRLYAHLAEGAREFCTDEVPALARGFDGPLLGRNGNPEGAREDAKEEAPETPAVGNGHPPTPA